MIQYGTLVKHVSNLHHVEEFYKLVASFKFADFNVFQSRLMLKTYISSIL